MLREDAHSRLFLTSPDSCDSIWGREFDTQVVRRWNGLHGVEPWGSHDHVVDGRMIDYLEFDDFCDLLGHDW